MTTMTLESADKVLAREVELDAAREVKAHADRRRRASEAKERARTSHAKRLSEGEGAVANLLVCKKALATICSNDGGVRGALARWGGDKAANLTDVVDAALARAQARLERERANKI